MAYTDEEDFDTEGWMEAEAVDDYEENWSQVDKEMFGSAWVASMEALDQMPLDHLSSDGFISSAWIQNQKLITGTITSMGFTDTKLLLQRGDELTMTAQLISHLGLELTQAETEWHRRNLVSMIKEVADREPLAKRIRGEHLSPTLQRIQDISQADLRRQLAQPSASEVSGISEVGENWMIPGPGKRSGRGRQSEGVDVITRASLEREQQAHWSKQVVKVLTEAAAPLTVMAGEAADPQGVLLGAVGATRGSTMESYTKTLIIFLQWLKAAYNSTWPDSVIKVVEFLHTAGSKPCSPSFPSKFLAALAWFEKVGGWAQADRYSGQELVKRTTAYWTDSLRDGVSPLKQAPRLPWMVLAAIELYVINDTYPLQRRLKAWTIGIKSWATLREDDSQHISAHKLRFSGELLITELMRSKTTGTAKRTRQLPVAILISCSITRTHWLETGLALARDANAKGNDFLLPKFGKDGNAMREPLSYQESAGLSKSVFGDLRVPIYSTDKEEWEESDEQLIPCELASYWTEHSPRSVIPSAAQVLEFSKDERNYLGRWSPGGADEYGRAYRMVVHKIQKSVWHAVLSADKRLAENDILDRMDQWGRDRNIPEGKVELLRDCLSSGMKAFWDQVRKAGGPPDEEIILQTIAIAPVVPSKVVRPSARKGKFLVVYTRNRKSARLHRVGGCAWTSVTLADCQEVVRLSDCMYDTRCKLCWPELVKKGADAIVSEDSSGSEM